MPQEQQFQGGTFTPTSGLVQHTAKPLEAFNQVGDALQQRYWQAKQQYNVLDQTIKNMNMFDREVDQQHIDAANKKISDTINPIIDNDDFHKAQGVVMDLTREVTNDAGIKAVAKNAAMWQQSTAEFDKRMEKEPDIRLAEARRIASAKAGYRAQGGGLDKNGNYQQIPIWEPQTDMNLAKYKDKIRDATFKLEGIVSHVRSTGEYNLQGLLKDLPGKEGEILRQYYDSHKSFKSLTKERIDKMAEGILQGDATYQATLKDVVDVQLFNATGLFKDDGRVMSKILENNSELTKRLSLQESKGYAVAYNELANWYNNQRGNIKSNEQAKALMAQFDNKKQLLEKTYLPEGAAKLNDILSHNPNEASKLYNDNALKNLHDTVLHSSDAFAYVSQLTDDKNQINTSAITDRLLSKIDKQLTDGPTVSVTGGASTIEEMDLSTSNPSSPEFIAKEQTKLQLETLKSQLSAKNATSEQKIKYQKDIDAAQQKLDFMESKDATTKFNLQQAFETASPEEKIKILTNAWDRHRLGALDYSPSSQALFGKTIDGLNVDIKEFAKFINQYEKINAPKLHTAIASTLGFSVADKKTQYILLQTNPKELFDTNPQRLISKYGKSINFTKDDINLLTTKVNDYTYSMYNSIASNSVGKSVKTYTLTSTGTKQDAFDQMAKKDVVSQILAGKAIDLSSNKQVIPSELFASAGEERHFNFMDKDPKTLNVNDIDGVTLKMVNSHAGAKGVILYQVGIPIKDKHNNIVDYKTSIYQFADGDLPNDRAYKTHLINKASQQINTTSSTETGISMTAVDGVSQLIDMVGNTLKDTKGNYIKDLEPRIQTQMNNGIFTETSIDLENGTIYIQPLDREYVNIRLVDKKTKEVETIEGVSPANITKGIATFLDEYDGVGKGAVRERIKK